MCSNPTFCRKACSRVVDLGRLLRRLRFPKDRVTDVGPAPAEPATATLSTEADMSSSTAANQDDHLVATPLRIFVRNPRHPIEPVTIRSPLAATWPGAAPGGHGDDPDQANSGVASELARLVRAEVTVTPAAMKRLFGLWNAVNLVGADEIGDSSIQATASATAIAVGLPLPMVVRSIGATVFSDGTVSFYIVIEGVDTPLWFVEQLDLADVSA